ncbi:MAG: hypothetical protein GSR84_01085 [Desulfurococcales archaeon]|nr:hypothetical protein [Desulfurococcales archaeon]
MEEECTSPDEDLARLASLTRRVAVFAGAAAGAYYFFAYGMAVMGALLLAAALEPSPWAIAASIILGIALATILTGVVATPVWRHLATLGLPTGEPGLRSMIGFALGFPLAYLPTPLLGGWYGGVAWYIGLGASLALAGLLTRPHTYWTLLAGAGLSMLATSPIPLALEYYRGTGEAAASGLLLLVYLATGSMAMRRAARVFEEAG